MKTTVKIKVIAFLTFILLLIIVTLRLKPLWQVNNSVLKNYTVHTKDMLPVLDPGKKNILIMADNNGTEMFDMMAPYYLFNATGKANVYVVAQHRYPVLMKKGPYLLPHFTYREIDSLRITADVIVIPFMNEPDSPDKISWIQKHYADSTKILSICDGAWTAAATGLYDGKPLTAHATDYERIKKKFLKPHWVNQVSVTQSGNLFSTAGVSNAAEGSLVVIEELFGKETMLSVLKKSNYPSNEIKRAHESQPLHTWQYARWIEKLLFNKSRNLGILLHDGLNEFELAAIYDTYSRSFPATLKPFSLHATMVTSKYGLTLFAEPDYRLKDLDEVHLIDPQIIPEADLQLLKHTNSVIYSNESKNYIFNTCFDRIGKQYGDRFKNLIKQSLDYN
jgi:putative intracellular protease/amidase